MLTLTDLFCGAGGSSSGATNVPGVKVRMAANHWKLAVETHNTNHPDAAHDCADLSQVDPRRYPTTDLLWASPECTNHTGAKGKKRPNGQAGLFGDPLPDEAAERSRATMWDVVRFTEHHQYRAVIVENVVEAYHWPPFQAWLLAMDAYGYDHQVVFLNSMHAQTHGDPAPQSRDRMYVVFHKRGNPRPDVDGALRPAAYCPDCDTSVRAVQAWKNPTKRHGRYRQQYVYRCPNYGCRNRVVEPAWLPAESIIDWSNPGVRVGDRERPLAAKTRARIAAGIARYWHTANLDPLAVPVEGRDGKAAASMTGPLRTQTTRNETGVAFPPLVAELRGGGSHARPATHPLATVTAAGNHHALVVPYYSTGVARPVEQPVGTVSTVDRHALVMRNNAGGAEMSTPVWEPVRTLTTAGHQSLLRPPPGEDVVARANATVDDVLFRMLEPGEIKQAMAFTADYRLLGNKREQVRMAGNAVTPPAARDLIATVAASLN